jgi:hypothetical protein
MAKESLEYQRRGTVGKRDVGEFGGEQQKVFDTVTRGPCFFEGDGLDVRNQIDAIGRKSELHDRVWRREVMRLQSE